MKLFGHLISKFRRKKRVDYQLTSRETHPKPEEVRLGQLIVVTSGGHPKWAYLRCPCPAHDLIRLCLIPDQSPNWTITESPSGVPTVFPSIWQLDGCFSHFTIYDGHVHWARGSGKRPRRRSASAIDSYSRRARRQK